MRISDWSSDVCSSDLRSLKRDGGEIRTRTVKHPARLRFQLQHIMEMIKLAPCRHKLRQQCATKIGVFVAQLSQQFFSRRFNSDHVIQRGGKHVLPVEDRMIQANKL